MYMVWVIFFSISIVVGVAWVFFGPGVKQHAKLTRYSGGTALKSFHPELFNIQRFVGEIWSVNHAFNCRNQKASFCQWRKY